LLAQVAVLTPGFIELGLEVGGGGPPAPRRRSPPSGVGGQELAPGEEQSFGQAEFLGDDGGGFATGKPVADSLPLEGPVELAAGSGRGFFDGLHGTRSPFLTVREIEATSVAVRYSRTIRKSENNETRRKKASRATEDIGAIVEDEI